MKTLKRKYSLIKGIGAIALIMIAFAGNSQSLNLKAGLNISRVNFYGNDGARIYDNVESNYDSQSYDVTQDFSGKLKSLYGWNAGLTYEFKSKRKVSFETGISYMTKGYRYENRGHYTNGMNFFTTEHKSKMILHYLSIPLTMKFNFLNKGIRVYGNFGADLGVALVGDRDISTIHNDNGDIGPAYFGYQKGGQIAIHNEGMAYNASLMAGMGIEYKNIFIEANYSAGIMNVQSIKKHFAATINKDLIISVGYKFKFKKKG